MIPDNLSFRSLATESLSLRSDTSAGTLVVGTSTVGVAVVVDVGSDFRYLILLMYVGTWLLPNRFSVG